MPATSFRVERLDLLASVENIDAVNALEAKRLFMRTREDESEAPERVVVHSMIRVYSRAGSEYVLTEESSIVDGAAPQGGLREIRPREGGE